MKYHTQRETVSPNHVSLSRFKICQNMSNLCGLNCFACSVSYLYVFINSLLFLTVMLPCCDGEIKLYIFSFFIFSSNSLSLPHTAVRLPYEDSLDVDKKKQCLVEVWRRLDQDVIFKQRDSIARLPTCMCVRTNCNNYALRTQTLWDKTESYCECDISDIHVF